MTAGIWERFERRQGRWWMVIAVLLGVALTLPSLGGGWVLDDIYIRWANVGSVRYGEVLPSRWDAFKFLDGNAARTEKMMDMGLMSWWTYPNIRGAFWRPVTCATYVLDYALWPDHPALMRVQSILWYAGLIACVWLLYKRFMGPGWAAGVAAILFALDDTHGLPIGMLAGRNALVSALFGVLAIYAHDKWRNDRRWAYGVLGPILLALSLLSAEAGIGVCAYLAAYEVTMGYGTWRKRLVALLPYAAIVAVWRTAWSLQGYGVDGVLVYTDPVAHPLRFAWQAAQRLPALLMGQWGPVPVEVHLVLGAGSILWMAAAGVAMMGLLAWAMWPLLRRDPVSRFWGLAMLLAVVPACAMSPMNRQLIFAGIGAMALLGQFITQVWQEKVRSHTLDWGSRTVKSLAVVMVVIHGVIAPAELCYFARNPLGPRGILAACDEFPGSDSWTASQDLIIMNHPFPDQVMHFVGARDMEGQTLPGRIRILASAYSAVIVGRVDERTLVVRPVDGYLGSISSGLMRDREHPLAARETIELGGMTVIVGGLNSDGRPAEATFEFDVPLEDATLRWVYWYKGAFRVFVPPGVGQSVVVILAGGLSF